MIPAKPFASYKWRWLSVQPSENLLQAPIFLGVLRALARHEGDAFSSVALRDDLQNVQLATRSPVTLARNTKRNLFRNSGQYWRGTGLLVPEPGIIRLTGLGSRVAAGSVTQGEFAALMVQQTVLPNPATYTPKEMALWNKAGLQIRPLKLILEVITALGNSFGLAAASLNNFELVRLVIPLAGVNTLPDEMAQYISRHRQGTLSLVGWPDCAPEANDWRLAREFLLFLSNFGILLLDSTDKRRDYQRFRLEEIFDVDAVTDPISSSIFEGDEDADEAVEDIRHSDLPSMVERQRVLTQSFARKGQSAFRSKIIQAYNSECVVTGEKIVGILEAAHIVPVKYRGSDAQDNGFCMRVDIHRLYDSGELKVLPDGTINKSDAMVASVNYNALPDNIMLPNFVNPANLLWRNSYL